MFGINCKSSICPAWRSVRLGILVLLFARQQYCDFLTAVGALAKLRKATISFAFSVCISVCLYLSLSLSSVCLSHETTQLQLNEFS